MTLAGVTPECVDALTEPGTRGHAARTLVHVHTGSSVRRQLKPWRRALTAHLSLQHLTAILAVGHTTGTGISTCPVRHQHIAIEAVALVAAVCVHAPVFARPGLQTTLVQVLIAGFSSEAGVTLAFAGSYAVSMLTPVLAQRLAVAPGAPGPSPAAVDAGAVATQPIGRGHLPRPPAVILSTCP